MRIEIGEPWSGDRNGMHVSVLIYDDAGRLLGTAANFYSLDSDEDREWSDEQTGNPRTPAPVMARVQAYLAAPSLLAACEVALGYIEERGQWGASRLHALNVLESAIRAARGGSDD
jgi:hypothetical protein